MKYKEIMQGVFVERPNRFIAKVLVNGTEDTVHVKNTGRCRELLVPGCTVYLSVSDNPQRQTKYDLVTVEKVTERGVITVNMDSQIPNAAAEEWLRSGGLFSADALIKREVRYGESRFDFYIEDGDRRAFLEVKGVTLENDGVAMFPDAPTERGVKHIKELVAAVNDGYEAYVLFVIQMKGVHEFRPNDVTHKGFADALRFAVDAGVKIIAMDCIVMPDSMKIDVPVNVKL
ncbi:MAG: DNA/RNA nuclease SfsA [Ruminococcaceae bacterium]|nr:DNA/RNA nuclease SfsA [Oscillospiraceae bacterium]